MSAKAETGWVPDLDLRRQAVQAIEIVIAASNRDFDDQAAIEAVSGFGRLKRMGERETSSVLAARLPDPAALARRALAAFDFSGLEAAALAFAETAPDLADADEDTQRAAARVLEALAARDRTDQLLTGAEVLLGQSPGLDDERQSLLMEFESLVRPELFRAVPLNEARAEALAGVAPSERSGLWWYAQGVGLPSDALDALATTAEMIHRFPEAEDELRLLCEAEGFLVGLGRPAGRLAQPLLLGEMGGQRREEAPAAAEREQPEVDEITGWSGAGRGSDGGRTR